MGHLWTWLVFRIGQLSFIGQNKTAPEKRWIKTVISSKYGSGFTYVANAIKKYLTKNWNYQEDTISKANDIYKFVYTATECKSLRNLQWCSLTKATVKWNSLSIFLKNR